MPGPLDIPPSVSLALEPFGLRAESVVTLSGYHDEGYAVDTTAGRYVLKIAPAGTPEAVIDFETSVVKRVLDAHPHLPVPSYRSTGAGTHFATVEINGIPRHARVLEFVEGLHYADFRPHTRSLRQQLGQLLGRIDAVLIDYVHPAMNRHFEWDLARALDAASLTELIHDPERRRLIDEIFITLADDVTPRLADVRRSVIHSDANDFNLLVDCTPEDGSPRITGLLDFGDTVFSHTINELAIACAYGMLGEPDPISAACDVVRGYHAELPLTEVELEVLYPLARSRLAVSATFSARWRHKNKDEDKDAYHTISERAVWDLLDRLQAVDSRFAHYAFRDACGLEACPRTPAIRAYIESCRPSPVIPDDPRDSPACVIDLSVGSTGRAARYPDGKVALWSDLVRSEMEAAHAVVGVGRYDEARACYTSSQFQTFSGEPRTVHLGIDLFVADGTPVFAPMDGVVHSFRDNSQPLDYGPTVILEHSTPDESTFFTLYGHLSRESLKTLEKGQHVARGEQIGAVGAGEENGGWPPHLHFQLITDMLAFEGNFPGVARASARSLWKSLSPDPNLILQIPVEAFPGKPLDTEEIRRLRDRHTGRNLGLSYRLPLHIVRGRGQFLFDVDGRPYLDCVNNVAHVGHSHPRVVEAIARQAAVLNTNTRYLHENLVLYAQRLTSTFPDALSVCFLVNSGSEANDLALRMARAYTGGDRFVVLGGAYHGHLTSLIDVSPYKSRGPGGSGPPPHVHELSTPDMFRGVYAGAVDHAGVEFASEMHDALGRIREDGGRVAAFIAESALSCAGQIMLPRQYLASMYDEVRGEGGVCIADEVQVGFGRVGTHFWAFETQNVIPDIVTLGKPIGNGHPIGAVITTREIADSFANGMEYFNTFGGNPVSCAAGLAVLEVLEDEGLQGHALRVGTGLLADLRSLAGEHPCIGDVRGSGLFLGIEIVRPGTNSPDAGVASYVVDRLKHRRILLSTDGPDHNVIKIKPPMVFSVDDAALLVSELAGILQETFVQGRSPD